MKIVIIEKDIDVMGGVERIINILANNLSQDNEVTVISEHQNVSKPFFEYNDNVKIKYILNRTKIGKFNKKRQSIIFRVLNKLQKEQDKIITRYLKGDSLSLLKEADCIIFGRVQVALHFLPFLVKNNIQGKIIVRDAIHLAFMSSKMKEEMLKYFPRYVDTFIVSSDESIKKYQAFFGNNKVNIVKIYNPLGIVPKGNYDFNAKTIVSLGRIEHQKGYENLVLAFKRVSDKYSDWKLKIYGTGPDEEKLKSLIEANNLSSKVMLLPGTSDVIEVLNESSIFVTTSRYEGYANVLVEAMSCGMPCISFDWLMGADDIINNGENGIIVPLNNREAYFKGENNYEDAMNLAKALESLISNPQKCEQLSNKAKEIIKSRDKDIIIKKWKKIISVK